MRTAGAYSNDNLDESVRVLECVFPAGVGMKKSEFLTFCESINFKSMKTKEHQGGNVNEEMAYAYFLCVVFGHFNLSRYK